MTFPPFPLFQGSFIGVILNIGTIWFDGSITTTLNVLLPIPTRETPLLRGEDLLTTRELELGPPQRLHCSSFIVVFTTNRHQRLSDVNASNGSLRFPVSTSHARLEPISSSTRQHFVDAYDVERMHTDSDMELVLTGVLRHVLVAANTSSF